MRSKRSEIRLGSVKGDRPHLSIPLFFKKTIKNKKITTDCDKKFSEYQGMVCVCMCDFWMAPGDLIARDGKTTQVDLEVQRRKTRVTSYIYIYYLLAITHPSTSEPDTSSHTHPYVSIYCTWRNSHDTLDDDREEEKESGKERRRRGFKKKRKTGGKHLLIRRRWWCDSGTREWPRRSDVGSKTQDLCASYAIRERENW